MSRQRIRNAQVIGAGQLGAGDRTAEQAIPWYSSNPETYTNPVQRWRQYVVLYTTSWEARKITSIPVDDALRKPFLMKGISDEAAQILKRKFDRIQLIPTLKRSLKLERLLGGCLTFMGLESSSDEPEKEYFPAKEKSKLRFINSIPVSRISRMTWNTDPLSEHYMRPDSFFINSQSVHVSRCLLWDGEPLFDPNDFALTQYRANLAGFGPSVLGTLWDDIVMACGTRQAAYQMVLTNNAIIAAIEDLQDLTGTNPGQRNLKKIQDMVNQLSAFRATIVDGEKVDVKTMPASFGSVPELLMTYLQVLSAASDIPASRFLGEAPGGLSGGDDQSSKENYYNMIDAYQHERITPQLLRLCDVVGYSEIPNWDKERDELEIEWPPLWNETAKEQAERASLTIDNVMKLVDAALMGDEQAIEEINARGILSVKLEKDDLQLLGEARDAVSRVLDGKEEDENGMADSVDAGKQIERLRNIAAQSPHLTFEEIVAAVAKRDNVDLTGIPETAIRKGAAHEMEHRDVFNWDNISDQAQCIGIALDHLREDPKYYEKLEKIENQLNLPPLPEPTEAQIASGNYRKHHIRLHGLDIAVENPKGSVRKGVDPVTKKVWSVTMPYDYGYIKRTEGADGDHVDVCIGPDETSDRVWIIDQVDLNSGAFDEHKCLLGCANEVEAMALYQSGFSDGRGDERMGTLHAVNMDTFKRWLAEGDTTKPFQGSLL